MRLVKIAVMGLLVWSSVSCSDDDFDDDDDDEPASIDGTYALEGADAANWDAASTFAATDSLDDPFFMTSGTSAAHKSPSTDPEEAAKAAADAADKYFSPSSCVTTDTDGGEVMYTLSSCDGPLGLRQASGTIHVMFEKATGEDEDAGFAPDIDAGMQDASLAFDVSSHGLTIDGAGAVLDAHGTYARTSSGDKQIILHSQGKHTRLGFEVKRDVMTTAHWKAGTQCVEVNANGTLKTLGQTFDLTVDGFTRCASACPRAGTVRVVNDRTVTLTLDGTDQPDFTSSNGTSGSVDLDCE
jgi:hypothetical protein